MRFRLVLTSVTLNDRRRTPSAVTELLVCRRRNGLVNICDNNNNNNNNNTLTSKAP